MHHKIISLILLTGLVASGLVNPPVAMAVTTIPITAVSAVLMDSSSGQLLYTKNLNARRAPASTTKILTALVVAENMDLDAIVVIPASIEGIEPSKINLRGGERFRVRDLLKATLINSANDAAETLAIAAGGSLQGFATMMNRKAGALGCRDSHFVRASGLPAGGHYSTAYDMALIMRAAQKNTFLFETMRIKTTAITSLDGRRIYLKNHNKMLLRGYNEVIGKTGWTRNARHCFVGQMKLFNRRVFISMLGSHALWRDLRTILRYQFGGASLAAKAPARERLSPAEDIKRLQLALKRAGYYSGPINGKLGNQTKLSLKKFQKASGLVPDGIIGEKTVRALSRYQ
jgi:D-alanyl-D-alanine carboxypeptidase (penicillin-binding protein 5/6)